MDFEEKFLERYEKLSVDLQFYKDKVYNLTNELQEKSRAVEVLAKTTRCYNDFIDNQELRCDYESFKDKWLAKEESK